ncbi:hypothetical protein AYI69_g10312, partial [Smittium culicis]
MKAWGLIRRMRL